VNIKGLADRLDALSIPEPTTGCHLWLGAIDAAGYGKVWLDGRTVHAPRASWMAHRGPIPSGLIICHRCDNPPCINPDHLFVGTHKDNAADRTRKGRFARCGQAGEINPAAVLSKETVIAIFTAEGGTMEISRRFGVPPSSVSGIRLGQRWRSVTSEAPA